MAKKYDEMSKEEKKSVDLVLKRGYAFDNSDFPQFSTFDDRYGLCASCKEFQLTRTEYKVLLARCGYSDLKLNDDDPVVECSLYDKRGTLTLEQMIGMAYLLETNRKKVGFLDE